MIQKNLAARGSWVLVALVFALGMAGCATTTDQSVIKPMSDTTGSESDARNRSRIHAELAAGYLELGNIGVALEEANVAVQADPSYATAFNVAALVFIALKDDRRAEENYNEALRLSPSDPGTNHNYGSFLCQRKREDEGIKYLMTAVENPLYQTPERSLVNAGVCAKNKGDAAAARTFFQRAVTIQPNQPQALYQLADISYAEKNYTAAQGYLRQYARSSSANVDVLWLAVRVERKLGNSMAEQSYSQQLRKNYPGSKEAAALQTGQFD